MGKSSGGSSPQQPSASQMTAAQGAANEKAAAASAKLSAVDQYTPYGSVVYQRRADGTPEAVRTTLNATDQATLDQQRQIAASLTNKAQQATQWIPSSPFSLNGIGYNPASVNTSQLKTFNPAAYTPQTMNAANYQVQQFSAPTTGKPTQLNGQNYQMDQLADPGQGPESANIWGQGQGEANLPYDPRSYGDVSQISQNAADSVYNAGKARLDPQFQQQQSDMMQMLSDRGIPLDSKAAQTVMSNMARDQSDAFGRLANDSYMAGHQVAGDTISRQQSLRSDALGEQSLNRDWQNQDFMRDFGVQSQLQQQNNAATQAQLGADASIWDMGNQAYQRDFDMSKATNEARNANLMAQYGIDTGIHDQRNADYMLGFNNQLTTTNQQNQDWLTKLQTEQGLRNQQIQESQMVRNSAINDVSLWLQGAPAMGVPQAPQTPSYNVGAVDVMGAHQMQYNAQLQQQQMRQQQQSSMWGALGQGASAAAGLWMMSSKRLKDTLGDADTFLGRVSSLKIRTWRYSQAAQRELALDGEEHLGPYAEEFSALFGGPNDRISLNDAIFILWRAFQELAKEVADACDNRAATTA